MAMTPWCPRCGDWRGYAAAMCKGCFKIEEMLCALPQVQLDPKTKVALPTTDATPESIAALKKARMEAVSQRFAFICDKRTEREAFTQMLEDFVDTHVDGLKSIAYEWANLRASAKQFRFQNMYALEMAQAMELALAELGAISLELSKYDKNTPRHEEQMQRVMSWMSVLKQWRNPEPSPEPAPVEEENTDDESAGEQSSGQEA